MSRTSVYMAELSFNLNRFVDEDVRSGPVEKSQGIPEGCYIAQEIKGDYNAISALYADTEALTGFAAGYSKIGLDHFDDIVNELAADFLNLHNGLFLVNLSEAENVESTLLPPVFDKDGEPLTEYANTYIMPVYFGFGTVFFVLSEN